MEDEQNILTGINTMPSLRERLSELEDPSQRLTTLLEYIDSGFGEDSAKKAAIKILRSRLPKIAYFSEYLRMPGQVAVNDLKTRVANNDLDSSRKVFIALLDMIDMIGRSVEDLEQIDQREMLTAQLGQDPEMCITPDGQSVTSRRKDGVNA